MKKSVLNAEQIKVAAEIGAQAALETLKKEREKQVHTRHDRRLRNTKLLLRNFRMFREHADNAVFDLQEINENALDILDMMMSDFGDNNALFVESIKKSVARTVTMVNHITVMINIYHAYCLHSAKPEDMRRYRIIDRMYISGDAPVDAQEVAEAESIDKRTVYKDVDAAMEKLSALIFGIDGLHYK